jgi:hypothetical protein
MARATKTPKKAAKKNKDTTLTDGAVSGDGEAYFEEKLSDGERGRVGTQLAELLTEIAELEQEARDSAGTFRNDLKKMREDRDVLRDQYLSGVRKKPAQQKLPNTEARG